MISPYPGEMPMKTAPQLQPQNDRAQVNGSTPLSERIYKNLGNAPVVALVNRNSRRVLDVGCGAGDNAALLKAQLPDCDVFGITYSAVEAERARRQMTECWVGDVETWAPEELDRESFDAILFSHVLEHLRHPARVVECYSQFLRRGGQVVIAVPNVLAVRQRLRFLFGSFEYTPEGGVMDDTHLHFYTYRTADKYLLSGCSDLRLTQKIAPGHVPLGIRGKLIPNSLGRRIDAFAGRHWPNLFGNQVIVVAEKL
jgi:2-polyprenyl-3-methyl-5-hydroxy-6-metoxy-1,4-benzoquinol methylase